MPRESRIDTDRDRELAGQPSSSANPSTKPTDLADVERTRFEGMSQSTGQRAIGDLQDRQLGEFRLLRRLGSGGMADVYLAEQTSLRRHVAIKVLRADTVADENQLQRFEQEATTAAGLNHPNLVQVYVIGDDHGVHFIAQEYVKGLNLKEFLARKGTPDTATAIHIIKQVASALQAADEAGIIHRDIKPENIMVTRRGEVKVADFGLAKLNESDDRLNLTQVGVTMGTPLYMSPEQVNGRKLDRRSDIYSFGVTCYHMLAGRPPFRGATALSVAIMHLHDKPEPLADRRPDLPRQLCQIVHRMMHKEPDKRYPTARAVLDDVNRLQKSLRLTPGSLDSETGSFDFGSLSGGAGHVNRLFDRWQWKRRWREHRQIVLFLASCVAVAFLSAGVGWVERPGNPLDSEVTARSGIQKQTSPTEQYLYAQSLTFSEREEDAWKAVGEFYPDAVVEKRLADLQLARLYLRSERLEDAREIFGELAVLGAEDPSMTANGIAGLAVVSSLQKDFRRSQELISTELKPVLDRLDSDMRTLIYATIENNKSELGEQEKRELLELFRPPPVTETESVVE